MAQILILTIPIYYLLKFLRKTRGYRILMGITVSFVFITLVARALQLDEIGWLLDNVAINLPLVLVVLFQPELRRIFAEIGSRSTPKIKAKTDADLVREITNAVEALARQKIGALIAMERGVSLDEYTKYGRKLNSPVVAELLATLFYPNTPMHDGGVIIRDDLILSAGCVFPLANTADRRKAFGTRHRAAIGLSEESDALVIVVSEETGLVSIAYGGELIRGIEMEILREVLSKGVISSASGRMAAKSMTEIKESTPGLEDVDKVAEAIAKLKEAE